MSVYVLCDMADNYDASAWPVAVFTERVAAEEAAALLQGTPSDVVEVDFNPPLAQFGWRCPKCNAPNKASFKKCAKRKCRHPKEAPACA